MIVPFFCFSDCADRFSLAAHLPVVVVVSLAVPQIVILRASSVKYSMLKQADSSGVRIALVLRSISIFISDFL